MDKLTEGLSVIGPEDTTVLMGDLSWALDLKVAEADFRWIHEHIPGKKIILKGNHDYWWSTAAKFYKFCAEFGFTDQWILNNNAYEYGDYAICGTRGWFFEESRSSPQDEKVFRRELMQAGNLPESGRGQGKTGVSPLSAPGTRATPATKF